MDIVTWSSLVEYIIVFGRRNQNSNHLLQYESNQISLIF